MASDLLSHIDGITSARSNLLDRLSAGEQVDPREIQGLDQESLIGQSELAKGLRRSNYSMLATTQAFGGQMLEPLFPKLGRELIQAGQKTMADMPQSLRPEYETFEEGWQKGGLRGLGSKSAAALGELGPQIALMTAGALGGAGIGAGVGGVLRGAGAIGTGAKIGSLAGGTLPMVPLEGGETALNLADDPVATANTTPWQRAGLAGLRGGVNAALETAVPAALVAPRLLNKAVRVAPGFGPALGNVAKIGAAGAVGEYGTEFAQELTGQAAMRAANPATPWDLGQAHEAGLQGAVGGLAMGGLGGAAQGVYSNLGAAKDKAVDVAKKTGFQNITVDDVLGKLRLMSEDPEAFGAQMGGLTLDGIDKMAEGVGIAKEWAGKGVEAAGGLVDRLRTSAIKQVSQYVKDPELKNWFVKEAATFGSMNPAAFKVFRESFKRETGREFLDDLGAAANFETKEVVEKAPKVFDGFVAGVKGYFDTIVNGKPGKAAITTQNTSINARKDFLQRLRAVSPVMNQYVDKIRELPRDKGTMMVNGLIAMANDAGFLSSDTEKMDGARRTLLQEWESETGTDLRAVLSAVRDGATELDVARLAREPLNAMMLQFGVDPKLRPIARGHGGPRKSGQHEQDAREVHAHADSEGSG
jgi:hypothetical protein